MEREIKYRFRLKLLIDNFGSVKKGDVGTYYISLLDEKAGLVRFPIDPHWEILSCDEFTGIKGINEVDIYENDIVLMGSLRSPVYFRDGSFMTNIGSGKYLELSQNGFEPEVVGNKHETPELLENAD